MNHTLERANNSYTDTDKLSYNRIHNKIIQIDSLKYIIRNNKNVNNTTFDIKMIDKLTSNEKLKYYDNLYFNPNCYSYFYGIKVTTILTDIYWRLVRSRPNQYAVLIAYNKLLNLNIQIPKLPKFKLECPRYYKAETTKDYYIMPSEKEYYMLVVDSIKNKELKQGIIDNIKKVDIDRKKFVNTIQFALRNKFYIKMTKEELNEML